MTDESKDAQVAINGFIASILIIISSVGYVLWAVLPDAALHRLHMTYYPDRYWAVAVPAILVMFFFYYFSSSVLLTLMTTHPLDDGRCITDVDGKPDKEVDVRALANTNSSVSPWVDIPVSVASRLLFEPWKEKLWRFHTGSSPLQRLLRHTADRANTFALTDVYKLGVLLKEKQDILELYKEPSLLRSLSQRYQTLKAEASPFQSSLLDAVFGDVERNADGSCNGAGDAAAVETSGSTEVAQKERTQEPVQAHEYFNAILELIREAQSADGGLAGSSEAGEAAVMDESERQCSSSMLASVERHFSAMEPQLRQLQPVQIASLTKALALANYTNYSHTVLLTRRCCEVAPRLKRRELCQVYYNLHRLHTRDSLTSIVNQLLGHVSELTAEEVTMICQALERQENTSSSSQRLLAPLVSQAVKKLPDAGSPALHRSLLVAMARYNHLQPNAVDLVVRSWSAKWIKETNDRDTLRMLQAVMELGGGGKVSGVMHLVRRCTELVSTMDIRNIDRLMDVLSLMPLNVAQGCMQPLFTRIERDAGQLTVRQLVFSLQLLSTYPPAKGEAAVVSMAFAAAFRAPSMDAASLESVVISLAMLNLFSDDFFSIAHVLQREKGGIRSFEQAQLLLESCTPEMVAEPRGLGMLTDVLCTLAPILNDEEISQYRKHLVRLGVSDRETLQRIVARAKQQQRSLSSSKQQRKRRGGNYDPMKDLL